MLNLDFFSAGGARDGISTAPTPVSLDDVRRARQLLAEQLSVTPLVNHPLLDAALGCRGFVKLENTHDIGSFKIRGGLNLLAGLAPTERLAGLVTATRGNHGQSLARASAMHGVRCTIFVPAGNSPDKNAAMAAMGAEVIEAGHDFDAAMMAAEEFARQRGARLVHPAREPALIAGVGTVGLEILAQAGTLDVLFVPVGGGSLAAGISVALAELSPRTRIIGVQAENAPAMHHAWHTGEDRAFVVTETIADGLAVRLPVDTTLGILRRRLHDMVLVPEASIQEAIRLYASTIHQLAEGAAAAPLAAAMAMRDELAGQRVGLVLSGGNIDAGTLVHALSGATPRFQPHAMPIYPISELSYGY